MLKKTLKYTGITLLVLIALAFIIPVVFKKQIKALVKKEINKSLNAKVDFKDVQLSLFRHFPKVGIIVEDLTIVGLHEFAGDTLVAVEKLDASAGLFSVLKGKDIKVYSISLQSPRIHTVVNKDGKANWDIAKASTDTSNKGDTAASAFKLTLKKYSISNGYFLYRDEQATTYTELSGLEHEGSGNLTADVFTLSTSTKAASANFTQDNIPYLINTKTIINTAIQIDNNTNTYTFKTDDIELNNLKLNAEGFIQLINSSTYKMDMKFDSPSNDFKDILSMIPAVYKKDFTSIKASGKALFNGFVKGTYTPKQMPAYAVNLEIKDGSFQYPDLPKPVKNIQLLLKASSADGMPDNAIVDISKGHLEMDNEPFDFRFLYKNPVTAQWIDAAAKGKLDLSQLSKFIKLESGTKLSGLVLADAFVKGPLKALQAQTGAFTAGGFFDIKNLYYTAASFPQPIKNGQLKATLENSGGIADKTAVTISSGHIELGNDPVDFSLQLRNPVSSVDFSGHAKGRFTLDHLKQFTTLEPGTSISGMLNTDMDFAGTKKAIDQKQYDKIVLNGTAGFTKLAYKSTDYPTGITVSNSQLLFNPRNVTLSNLDVQYMNTRFTATGVLNNLAGYIMQGQPLTGSLNVNAGKMNLNDWMGTSTTTPATSTATASAAANNTSGTSFLAPADISLTINANAEQVKYDNIDYNNVNGTLLLNDEKVVLQNIKTDVLDGNVLLNGSYSTKRSKKEPDVSLSYDIKDMDVQKAFLSYNTIRVLMPIGKFLSGKLSSQLSLTGILDGNMMPELSSLTGKGNLLLLQGVLKKFAPLEKLAEVLQIDRLKSISVKDIKNYIEFANGRVLVKPFKIKVDEIEMEIGGFHGFDQSIDYAIQMKLPRSLMGSKGNTLVNNLATQANSKGIPVKLGETVNLNIKMTGSINNPTVSVNLKEVAGDLLKDLEQQVKEFAQAKLDSAKQKAKDSLQEIKQQVTDKIKETIKEQIFGKDTAVLNNMPKDSLPKKPGESIKDKIKDIFNRPKKVVKDSLKQ